MDHDEQSNRKLADYLYQRLQILEHCISEITTKICADKINLCKNINDGIHYEEDPAIIETIKYIEYIFGNTFRYAMLVSICSFLEEAMKAITKRLVSDYEGRLPKIKKGNWLHKHISILHDAIGFDETPIQPEIDTFHYLITLRNCIVHTWGKIEEDKNPGAVKEAVGKVDTVEMFKDGYLYLGDQVLPIAINTAEEIIDSIITKQLNTGESQVLLTFAC